MPDEIIDRSILIAHEKARIIFEPFVPSIKLEGFNTAWKNYKNGENTCCPQNMGCIRQTFLKFILTILIISLNMLTKNLTLT